MHHEGGRGGGGGEVYGYTGIPLLRHRIARDVTKGIRCATVASTFVAKSLQTFGTERAWEFVHA